MRIWILIVAAFCLAACSGGTTAVSQKSQSTAVTQVFCSSTVGPVAGPSDADDAGDVQGCQPGGQCLLGGIAPGFPQPGPSWSCVYEAGVGKPGDDGGE